MSAIEVTGKSLEEAKKLAADKLGVEESVLVVTVLEEAKGKGLFGSTKVRIRAEKPATAVVEAPVAPKPKAEKPAPEPVAEEVVAEEAPAKPAPKGRGPKKPAKAEEEPKAEGETATEEEAPAVVATQEDAEKLLAALVHLMKAGDLEVTAGIKEVAGRYVTLELNGKDASYLVGKHGEVLNALQYMMNISAGRSLGNGVRTVIDGGDYRRKREEALTKMAMSIATEVRNRGEEAVLDALPAFERRIIHKAIGEIEGVVTYSEGEEPNRRVVIAPAE